MPTRSTFSCPTLWVTIVSRRRIFVISNSTVAPLAGVGSRCQRACANLRKRPAFPRVRCRPRLRLCAAASSSRPPASMRRPCPSIGSPDLGVVRHRSATVLDSCATSRSGSISPARALVREGRFRARAHRWPGQAHGISERPRLQDRCLARAQPMTARFHLHRARSLRAQPADDAERRRVLRHGRNHHRRDRACRLCYRIPR